MATSDYSMDPGKEGYYFPAEWEPHRATWLSLPLNDESWPGHMDELYLAFFLFVKALSEEEKIAVNIHNETLRQFVLGTATAYSINPEQLELYLHPTNDCWCRDHGPAFLKHPVKKQIVVDWEFNAWGGKYSFDLDNKIPRRISKALNIPCVCPGIVMEGGSVEFNGKGTILTTTSCLLHPNRNPGLEQHEIEGYLLRFYGADQVLWLEDGVAGDDTDGHIDDVTRFINEDTVLTVIEPDKSDENYRPLVKNRKLLDTFRIQSGKQLTVIELPMPEPLYGPEGRLPASYANFYIANNQVVVPVFKSKRDDEALEIIQSCFPDRKIKGIDSRMLIRGMGSFHCLCQQEPL